MKRSELKQMVCLCEKEEDEEIREAIYRLFFFLSFGTFRDKYTKNIINIQ